MITAIGGRSTAERQETYFRDGFVVVRSLFDPEEMSDAAAEADRLLNEFEALKSVKNLRCRWQNNVYTGECTFETFDP
jgi:2-aminoethylphosphonate dioxygenase